MAKKDFNLANIKDGFIILLLLCAFIGLAFVVNKVDTEFNDNYGYANANHLFKQKCEDEGLLFMYITQGLQLRCENDEVVKFYEIEFNYDHQIEISSD